MTTEPTMDKKTIIELLPWFENQSLEPDVQEKIRGELEASDELQQELADVRAALELHDYRPPVEALTAYALGEDGPIRREVIERLARLSPAVRAELDLVEESLADVRGRSVEEPTLDPALLGDSSAAESSLAGPWRTLTLAASLLCAVAVGGWIWSQRGWTESQRQLAALQKADPVAQPTLAPTAPARNDELEARLERLEGENAQLAAGKSEIVEELQRRDAEVQSLRERVALMTAPQMIALIELVPLGLDRTVRGVGDPTDEAVLRIPHGTGTVALVLASELPAETAVSRIELVDEAGSVLWTSGEKPQRDDLNSFTLSLPVSQFRVGEYRLRVLGGAGDESSSELQVLETYGVQIG